MHPHTHTNLTQTVGRFNMWMTPKTNRLSFCLIWKLSMHWMVCSVCYLGCMVVNINSLFAKWSTSRYCCLGFFLARYLFSDINALMATFHVLVNPYFLNFRLALLIVLRVVVHLIYLVIFNTFLVFNFPFLILNINFLVPE